MKTVLIATGIPNLDERILKFAQFEFAGRVEFRALLKDAVIEKRPDIIVVTDNLSGRENLIDMLLELKIANPSMHIVYIFRSIKMDDVPRVMQIGNMVKAGIDIIEIEDKISPSRIEYTMSNPTPPEMLQKFLRYHNQTKSVRAALDIEEEEDDSELDDHTYKNVFNISSIKPGTGKSYISVNLAMNIAKYGHRRKDGKPVRVAIIEADLQNLSLGTLLGLEDDNKNLKSAMEQISRIMSKDGELTENVGLIEEVNKFVLNCFLPYGKANNLHALVGSQLTMEEIENIDGNYYLYLIELVSRVYDIVIIDTNSSLSHVTTYPLLRVASKTFYILNLDYNNIRNNYRYKRTLANMDILDRVEFVLNENYDDQYFQMLGIDMFEDLEFTIEHLEELDFNLVAKMPMIPKTIFLNRLYNNTPIVLDDDIKRYNLLPKLEFARFANKLWPITNLDFLENRYAEQLAEAFNTTGGRKKRHHDVGAAALDEVIDKMPETYSPEELTPTPQEKGGFFSRLFGRK